MKKRITVLAMLLVMVTAALAETVNIVYTNDLAVIQGGYILVCLKNNDYEFYFYVAEDVTLEDIVANRVYTLEDMDATQSYATILSTYEELSFSSATLMRDDKWRYNATVTASNGITYTLSDGSVPPETPDTIHITMNTEEGCHLYDHTDEGYFEIAGEDLTNGYQFNLRVFSAQIAGNYTQNDIETTDSILLHTNGTGSEEISISEVRDFTITADGDTYSAYIELVAEDGDIYGIDFRHDIIDALDAVTGERVIVTTGEGAVTVHSAEGESMTLYDADGRLLFSGRLTSDTHTIGVSHSGIYFLHIGNTTHTVVVR